LTKVKYFHSYPFIQGAGGKVANSQRATKTITMKHKNTRRQGLTGSRILMGEGDGGRVRASKAPENRV